MATSDVLRLQTNIPETIALRFVDGLAVESKFGGDQLMFSLVDGRKMFLPPFVAKKIASSGIRPHESFLICKREVAQGNRRSVEYSIDLVEESAPVVEHHDNGQIHRVYAAPAPAAAPFVVGAVVPVAAPAAVAPSAAPAAPPAPSAVMAAAGIAAIDAVLEIEAYAQRRGMTDFVMGADNIQKIAVSLYIDMRKGGR